MVRRASPDDVDAVARMVARCSPRTRYRRFHGVVEAVSPAYLRRYLLGAAHEARVAELVSGRIVGVAGIGSPPGEPDVRELGVLAEDDWQRRGIGRALVSDLFAHAYATRVRLVRLEVCTQQPGLLDHVLAHLPVASARREGCDVTVDVTVDVPAVTNVAARPRSAAGTARRPPSSAARRPGVPGRP